MKNSICNNKGQSLIEYIILVAFMAIGAISIVRGLGQNVTSRYSEITHALSGEKGDKTYKSYKIKNTDHSRRHLGNYMKGVNSSTKGREGE